MNKISLYLFLILVYLGLSKSFSPSEQSIPYIEDEHALKQHFTGAPISLILLDSFQAGFLIHTYFHRYKAIYVFKESEEFVVRTSEDFWRRHLPHRGLSLLRRSDMEPFEETTTPVPPGSLFVGNPFYGTWVANENGERIWIFHNAYRSFPEVFYWGEFRPNFEFYSILMAHLEHNVPFFGMNKEFGTEGSITSAIFPDEFQRRDRFAFNFKNTFKEVFSFNRTNKQEPEQPMAIEDEPSIIDVPLDEIEPFLGERPTPAPTESTRSIFDIKLEDNNGDFDE
jgi:hypothetical protein